jgi:Uma2 family endonuclease
MVTLPQPYRWRRTDYEHLVDLGVFAEQAVELIGGQIVAMSPKGPRHAVLTKLIEEALEAIFPKGAYYVRTEQPLALGVWDAPEPDVAVVIGPPRDFIDAHPTAARTVLVVEIADTTLAYDAGYKADVYAAADIADYWIIDPSARTIEVCRRPLPTRESETGVRYADRRRVAADASIAPLAAPDRPLAVADLLP